jgi:hypothetical protein
MTRRNRLAQGYGREKLSGADVGTSQRAEPVQHACSMCTFNRILHGLWALSLVVAGHTPTKIEGVHNPVPRMALG